MKSYFYSPLLKNYIFIAYDDGVWLHIEVYDKYGNFKNKGRARKSIINRFYTEKVFSLPNSEVEEADEFDGKYQVS